MKSSSKEATALSNISRALNELDLYYYFTNYRERADRPYGIDATPLLTFEALRSKLAARDFRRDPGKPLQSSHPGGLESWREGGAVSPALQICLLENGDVDIDLDFFNPWGGDLVSFIGHGLEVLWHWIRGTHTNQRLMAKALDRRFGVKA